MSMPIRRLAAVLAAGALLAGCGAEAGPSAEAVGTGAVAPSEQSAYPVRIENRYGTTTIEAEPRRIVTIGYTDQDFVLALGVVPVAVRYWYGDEADPFRDWADGALSAAGGNEADVAVLNMPELNFEQIRVLRPDLIVAMYSGITEADYDTLTEGDVPVLTQTDEYADYGTPWQEVLGTVGEALGRTERAAALTTEIEGQVTAAVEANPQWAGQTVGVTTGYPGSEYGVSVFASQDPRSRFMTALGFTVSPEIDGFAGDQFFAQISSEQLDVVDTDVIVWDQLSYVEGGRATIEADPLLARLSAVRDGRVVWLGGDVEEAFGWQSPLSLPVVLADVVAQLETVAPAA